MPSAIDATKPVAGSPTTESVRQNFAAAKSEIELLQQTAGVGPQGPIGPVGPSGTIAVGSVTTGNPGTNATVQNVGTPQAATLNFTIPRGDAGTGGGGITETQAVDAVRQGQVTFQEAAVTSAPTWPTSPNLAQAPVVGTPGWSPGTGTATTTFTYSGGSENDVWGPMLSYPVTFAANEWYQIVWSASRTSALPDFSTPELYFYFGSGVDSQDHEIRKVQTSGGSVTLNVQAPGNYTHFIVQPVGNENDWPYIPWRGTFQLTRIVRHPGPPNSQSLSVKDWRVTVRGSNAFIGRGGRWATGSQNVGFGYDVLRDLTSGSSNIALGYQALSCNLGGNSNIAMGADALLRSLSGSANVSIGPQTLNHNVTGSGNVAVGHHCLGGNVTGNYNIGLGYAPAYYNITGQHNTVFGYLSLFMMKQGDHNFVVGHNSGRYTDHYDDNIGDWEPLSSCNNSIFIGREIKSAANGQTNEIVIGGDAIGHGSNTITLGNDEIVAIRANVQSISALSDSRVKENIQPANLDKCVDAVKNLPVSRWAWQSIAGAHPDRNVTGFMAEDMAKVFPKAVTTADRHLPVRNANGEVQMVAPPVRPAPPKPGRSKPEEDAVQIERPQQIPKMQEFKGLQYVQPTELLPTLWGAVQRLIQMQDELTGRLEQLKSSAPEPSGSQPETTAQPERSKSEQPKSGRRHQK